MSVRLSQKKRIDRKLISMLLVVAMLLFMLPIGAFAASSSHYSDSANHWARPEIEKWSGMGIIEGSNGRFRPDDPITRGELAVIADRIMNYRTVAKNGFSDLGQAYYTEAVLKADAAGIIMGEGAKIRPKDNLTREETVVIVGRALGLTEKSGSSGFSDAADISKWAIGYVNSAAERGYIAGSGNLFKPKASITRAEVVKILDNAIIRLFDKAIEYSSNVNGTAIVSTPGTVLKNMKITGDLIISEGVGNGDVTLNNVTVTGKTIVRGGGANSIHITGNSKIASIDISKTDAGQIRVVTSNSAVVDVVFVNDGNDNIILTGSFRSVNVAASANVTAVSADIARLDVTGGNAAINIDKNSKTSEINVANKADSTTISISGLVGSLTVNSRSTVNNNGTIAKAVVNTNGVVLNGASPLKVDVGANVTDPPKSSTVSAGVSGSGNDNNSGDSDDDSDNPPAAAVSVTGISLDKPAMSMKTDDAPVTLKATISPANATNKNVAWTSSKTTVATVSNGTVTPVAAGTSSIMAKTADGGFTATCEVTVTNTVVPVTGLSLDKSVIALSAGGLPAALKATVTPSGATNKDITWTSGDTAVATVADGTVTPVAAGTATITAKTADGGFTATCQVNVNAAAVMSGLRNDAENGVDYNYVTVSGLTPHVFVPVVTGSGSKTDFQNVSGMMETYGKANNIVAAINAGIFYNAGAAKQYCFNFKEPDGVTISNGVVLKSTESIDHTQCDILVFDEDGNIGWTDYYADADELVAGKGYYYDIHGNKVTGRKIVSAVTGFVPIVVDGESVYDPNDTVLNGFHNYVGHYMGQKTSRQIIGVKADGSYGILTNKRVFYPAAKGWNMQDAANIAVAEGFVFAYSLDGGGSAETVLASGSGDSYSVQTLYAQSTGVRELPTYIVFTSNNIAPVSATPDSISMTTSATTFTCGVTLNDIKEKLAVTETLTTASGKTAERKVFSRQGVDMSKTLEHTIIGGAAVIQDCSVKKTSSSPNGTLYYEKTDTETNDISLKNNSNSRQSNKYYDYSTGYTLSTADDLNTPGEKTITVSYTPGNGYAPLTGTVSITVNPKISVTGISLDKSAMTMKTGDAPVTLVATVMPENATNSDITWTSSNPAVALVTNGTVSPVAEGTTTITAKTVEGGFTATCEVTVILPVMGITLNKTAMALSAGGLPGTLKADVFGSTNNNVTWTSSNTAAATVANGAVSPVATGTATITATTVEGGLTATCKVTVNESAVASGTKTNADASIGTYKYVNVSGLTPHVFMPVVTGTGNKADFQNVIGMMNTFGKSNNIVVGINSGIFYNWYNASTQYCFNIKEPDGVVISDGVVLKSTEPIDHTQCDILVFDEDGNVGWTDYCADADALVTGNGYYYDIYGKKVEGRKIVSAVTGFVPVVIGGSSVYDSNDSILSGYHNFVGHYTQNAIRQIFGVKADGSYGILTNSTAWSLAKAAEAAVAEGFVFAYNLDGGGSTGTVLATGTGEGYTIQEIVKQTDTNRQMPAYIVFTSDNVAPLSATPSFLSTTMSAASFTCGVTLDDVKEKLTVTETFVNAKGANNTRTLFSRQGLDMSQTLEHTIIGGANTVEACTVKKTDTSPNGTLYYTKQGSEVTKCLGANKNTYLDGKYYDYSTGYTLSTTDDLDTPGEKTITVSYTPGDGYTPLTSTVTITVNDAVPVSGVSLDKTSITLKVGDIPVTLVATVTPAGATYKGITWSSSNTAVVTVSNGTIMPVAEGTATITVKTGDGDFEATCFVTVNPAGPVGYINTPESSGDTAAAVAARGNIPPGSGAYDSAVAMADGTKYRQMEIKLLPRKNDDILNKKTV